MKNRSFFLSVFLYLILNTYFLILPPSTAASIYNRSPWPPAYQDLMVEKDNTDALDAAHPCNSTHGRSFKLTHPETVKLSGLSVYIYLLAANENHFDGNAFRLSLFQLPSYELLVTRIPPTYANIIARDNSASPTFEVYFHLDVNISGGVPYTAVLECLTNESDLFRVPESSRVNDGLTEYYDSKTRQTFPYYLPGRKVLFTTFIQKGSPHFPPVSSSPTSSLSPLTSPKYHPVILIHGLGGRPENFENDAENRNYVRLLTDQGYPRDFIHLYSYGYKEDARGQRYYNYQGDVREIAQGLESVVNSLSEKHKGQGGDGKVDLIGHSLGTLVARQYLNTHRTNSKVRKFIAVGAPFKGSWVMDLDSGVRSVPGLGELAERKISSMAIAAAREIGVMNDKFQPISQYSSAAQQVRSDSEFLRELNRSENTPKDVKFYSIYGDIGVTFEHKVFNRTISKKTSIGDFLILPESAINLPGTSPVLLAYNDAITLRASIARASDGATLTFPTVKSLKYAHNNLLSQTEIKDKIKSILASD